MQKFLTLILFLTSIALLPGCAPSKSYLAAKQDPRFGRGETMIFRPGITESLVYRTTIQYRKKEFSSLTYLYPTPDSVFKLVLLSDFGNTLLEAEISTDSFTVHNVVSYLNRKPLLKLLEKDWRLLLKGNLSKDKPKLSRETTGMPVLVYSDGNQFQWYHYDTLAKHVTTIEAMKGQTPKGVVVVEKYRELFPEKFTLEHPSMKLKITFSLLKKVENDSAE